MILESFPGYVDFVFRCLNYDPAKRPTAGQCVNFLKEFLKDVSKHEFDPAFDLGAERLQEDVGLVRECAFILCELSYQACGN